VTKKEK